jgi:hypothetical protein
MEVERGKISMNLVLAVNQAGLREVVPDISINTTDRTF